MFNFIINTENNKDFLAKVKHTNFLDLSVVEIENLDDYAEGFSVVEDIPAEFCKKHISAYVRYSE